MYLMNTMLRAFCLLSGLLIVFHTSFVYALSQNSHTRLLKESSAYRDADRELNRTWKTLKKSLSREEYVQLLADQRAWLHSGRDSAAKALIGSGMQVADAYAHVTKVRTLALLPENTDDTSPLLADASTSSPSATTANEASFNHEAQDSLSTIESDLSFLQTPRPESASTLNNSAAVPSAGVCDFFHLGSRLYYGHYVPRPFITLNLKVKKARRIASLKVNNYEIRRIKRYSHTMPYWKRRSDKLLDLNIYSDTILKDISIVYADGTTCTIDHIAVDKDMTNPYN